jgi:hypothetical protein
LIQGKSLPKPNVRVVEVWAAVKSFPISEIASYPPRLAAPVAFRERLKIGGGTPP